MFVKNTLRSIFTLEKNVIFILKKLPEQIKKLYITRNTFIFKTQDIFKLDLHLNFELCVCITSQ